MKKIISEYRVELSALLVALSGVFLVAEQISIRRLLSDLLSRLLSAGQQTAASVTRGVDNYLNSFTLSDMTGWFIILMTGAFIVWRVRYRFIHTERWNATLCPRCGSEIRRVRRNPIDRFLSWSLLPNARRYHCSNHTCEWEGLRRRRSHSEPQGMGEIQ